MLDKSTDTNDFQLYLCENLSTWDDLNAFVSDSISHTSHPTIDNQYVDRIDSSVLLDLSVDSKSILAIVDGLKRSGSDLLVMESGVNIKNHRSIRLDKRNPKVRKASSKVINKLYSTYI